MSVKALDERLATQQALLRWKGVPQALRRSRPGDLPQPCR